MPPRRYTFITLDLVEQVFAETVVAFFRNYPDPVPNYQYLDGNAVGDSWNPPLPSRGKPSAASTCIAASMTRRRRCGVP